MSKKAFLSFALLLCGALFMEKTAHARVVPVPEKHACVFTVTTPTSATAECKNAGEVCTTVMDCLKTS